MSPRKEVKVREDWHWWIWHSESYSNSLDWYE